MKETRKAEIILMFDRYLNEHKLGLQVSHLYDKAILVDIDDKFYQNFAGQYYQGLPVNYILQRGRVGYGINAAEALTLAIGNGTTWCSGSLEAFAGYNDLESATRQWVEINDTAKSGYVIEPTWGLAIDRDVYHNIFGAWRVVKQDYAAFIKARKENPAAVNLYRREDYEDRGVPLNPQVIKHVQDEANVILESSRDLERRRGAERLLAALPNLKKCQNLVEPRVKRRLSTLRRFGYPLRENYGDMINELDPLANWGSVDYVNNTTTSPHDLIVKGY